MAIKVIGRVNGYDRQIYLVSKKDIGGFQVGYQIGLPSDLLLNEMINWLSINCTRNFIVFERRETILAGGRPRNLEAFENNDFDLMKRRMDHITMTPEFYQIRLHAEDDMMFRLRWICPT